MIIVGWVNGPKADQAKTIMQTVISWIRVLGIGTYKDEPGTVSMPFKGDTGKRAQVE